MNQILKRSTIFLFGFFFLELSAGAPTGPMEFYLNGLQTGEELSLPQVQSLLNEGGNPNALYGGKSLLHIAAERGDNNTIGELLNKGADINITGQHNLTPLHSAILRYEEEAALYLLREGADPLIKREHTGETPFQLAVDRGMIAVGQAVLDGLRFNWLPGKRRAFINQKNNLGKSALFYAVLHDDNADMVRWLLINGAEVDSENLHKETPLFEVVYEEDEDLLEIASILIEAGANPNHVTLDGSTPYLLALENDDLNFQSLLEKKGASLNLSAMDCDSWDDATPCRARAIDEIIYNDFVIQRGLNPNDHETYMAMQTEKICRYKETISLFNLPKAIKTANSCKNLQKWNRLYGYEKEWASRVSNYVPFEYNLESGKGTLLLNNTSYASLFQLGAIFTDQLLVMSYRTTASFRPPGGGFSLHYECSGPGIKTFTGKEDGSSRCELQVKDWKERLSSGAHIKFYFKRIVPYSPTGSMGFQYEEDTAPRYYKITGFKYVD